MTDASFPLKPEFKNKSIRSFVIRAGRMTDGQKNAFARSWQQYGVSLFSGPINVEQLFGRQAPLVVEVGFGMGDSLLQMCKLEPEKDFIGIEVHPPGVGRLINNAELDGVANLKVFMADATDVLEDCIADSSLARFQLYFPDPWHKKKHHKRRIVQPEFVALIQRKLQPGGICHFATDWQEYAEQMLEILSAAEGLDNCAGAGNYHPRPEHRPVTKFERRGENLGHGVWDLMFAKR
ncbi:tRNA (guanosine(46)-N7)-methyltransferase TrmB [Halioxenophilus sp. WMMB6]|uniref:tRNA (guanosine(46)-N7)-methyltransferase TrmB n=1 Tax=Halioxenophilus sp. WMMB6 TaxID=3073815 RepID=UPI00295ECB51|nr:tRNA (guanosine(46)-N7)-methyltransferase TrmB [Halioxenophilus sp. WMMB6]